MPLPPLDNPEARLCNQQAIALAKQGRLQEAEAGFRQALRLNPNYAEAYHNLGNLHYYQEKYDQARALYQEAVRCKPGDADMHNNLANACKGLDKLDEAAAHYQEAVRLRPTFAEAHTNLAITHKAQGKLAEALIHVENAIRLKPDYPEAHFIRSMIHLLHGDFAEGLPEYEWRWHCKQLAERFTCCQPVWDGSPLAGRTILLHQEGGLGDVLQFIRFVPLVKQQGGRVIVACDQALIPLLSRNPAIDEVVPQDAPLPTFDVSAMLMSLPRIFGTTLASIPADMPYLFPDPEQVQYWAGVLDKETRRQGDKEQQRQGDRETRRQGDEEKAGQEESEQHSVTLSPCHPVTLSVFRIGIAWQGNPLLKIDRNRSVPLTCFAPLAQVERVRLFSLQKGRGVEQLQQIAGRFEVTDLGNSFTSFADTAAAMVNLDLVICVDTAIAHCAGALGVPVWIALPFAPDWRWLLEREDSPWYPSMRLFRQRKRGDWEEVFGRIAAAIQSMLAKCNM